MEPHLELSCVLPKTAERVVEINSRHGRAEILAAVGFLVGIGM